ncbi:ATP-binding protein [Streptomyces sp. NPDC005507]|uniref:ATP-binding protein n=1 Tax=Streptomyces sp. NPDC005507 TaxID=3154885 RepID=UPI0033A32EE7
MTTTAPTPPSRPSQLPPPDKDHYLNLGLTGANIMATRALSETEDRIKKATKYNAIVAIHGHVGLGKTFAVHTALRRHAPDTTVRLRFRQAANMSEVRGDLWRALGLPGTPPTSADDSGRQIKEALEDDPRVLLFDEAQWLSKTALEYIRDLWGDDAQRAPILLVGSGNLRQKILSCPGLHSRILDWYQFTPLTPTEVQSTIAAYHPIWSDTHPDLILYTDDRSGHGSFRNWAKITLLLHDALSDNPELTLNKDLIRWVFSRLDSTQRLPPHRD